MILLSLFSSRGVIYGRRYAFASFLSLKIPLCHFRALRLAKDDVLFRFGLHKGPRSSLSPRRRRVNGKQCGALWVDVIANVERARVEKRGSLAENVPLFLNALKVFGCSSKCSTVASSDGIIHTSRYV